MFTSVAISAHISYALTRKCICMYTKNMLKNKIQVMYIGTSNIEKNKKEEIAPEFSL